MKKKEMADLFLAKWIKENVSLCPLDENEGIVEMGYLVCTLLLNCNGRPKPL